MPTVISDKSRPGQICLYGAGGHGRVVAAQMLRADLGPLCFLDDRLKHGSFVNEIQVAHTTLESTGLHEKFLVTIGDNGQRKQITERIRARSQSLATFVSPMAMSYLNETIGEGSQVLSGAVLNQGAKIADGVIINSCAVVEHDCQVGSYCHVSPNATLAGGACLGEGAWIGAGAIVLPDVHIAPWTIIGAGAVVTKDIDEPGTYVGVPARLVS